VVNGATGLSLLTQANGTDLEALLRVLDADSSVTTLSVYTTFTVPDITKMRKLTAADLGIELTKLK
jgi:hypothetical protein